MKSSNLKMNNLIPHKSLRKRTSNRKYVGQWKDSLPDGQGTYTFVNGKVEIGIWKKGELIKREK